MRPFVLGGVVLMCVAVGCGGGGGSGIGVPGGSADTLTRVDVSGLPAGDATGTAFSGTYLTTSAVVDACDCRQGSCQLVSAVSGQMFTLAQQDGALTVTRPNGIPETGGIDTDGTFWCGGYREAPGDNVYEREDGVVSVANGQPTGFMVTDQQTLVGSGSSGNYDCDVRVKAVAEYVSP